MDSYNILIVDDDQHVREELQWLLHTRCGGCKLAFQQASNEDEAIRFLNEGDVDLAVVDLRMVEVEGGFRVLKAARQKEGLPCFVILLTAYGTVQRATYAMQQGAFDFVEKDNPEVDTHEVLVLCVEKALAQVELVRRLSLVESEMLALKGWVDSHAAETRKSAILKCLEHSGALIGLLRAVLGL